MLGNKFCPRCKQTKPASDFYLRRNDKDFSVYCKLCTLEETKERLKEFKRNCVEYKGGKCESCGYNKYVGALEFHHKNPNEKDFTISQLGITSFTNRVRKELDKCQILCSNCHREEHDRLRFGKV